MTQAVFINLIVNNLKSSLAFFEKLGFQIETAFTNNDAAGLRVNESIFVMLHTPNSIKNYTHKSLVDSHSSTETLIALQQKNKEDVDTLLDRAIQAGAKEYRQPEDHGFMFARSFEDIDGHIWEAFWMDKTSFTESMNDN